MRERGFRLFLGALALASVLTYSFKMYAGTSTFSATPGTGATLRETTDSSGFFLPNTTIWDYSAGANGLQVNANHTIPIEGLISNSASAVATSANNQASNAWLYGFNGTTWDQLQVDASKFLKVNVSAGTVAATQSGTWTSRTVGNGGAVLDFAGQNAASPANAFLMGGQFNTTPSTITSGNASPFQLDSLGKLLVNCTGCSAAGNVGGFHTSVATTPTVQNAAYATGNAIGGLQTIAVWRSTSTSSGKIDNISIASKGGSTQGWTVYLWNTTPSGSTCTDKTAFSLAAADVSKMVAAAPIVMTPQVVGAGSTVTFASVEPAITASNAAVSTNVFMCVVVNGAVTPASTTDLVITVAASQD